MSRLFEDVQHNNELYNLSRDIFLDVLLQGSKRDSSLKIPFNFNRHKIMHGESVRYGRKDYLIRAMMILDYLASLK